MKIIRPMDLTRAGVVESNAPDDGYAQWQVAGRDLLKQYSSISISEHQGELWLLPDGDWVNSDNDGVLRRVDIATGDTLDVPPGQAQATGQRVRVSPDGSWVAVGRRGSGAGRGVYVYEVVTGNLVFSKLGVNIFLVDWSESSDYVFIRQSKYDENYSGYIAVSSATWQEVPGQNLEDFAVFNQITVRSAGLYGIVGNSIYYGYEKYYYNRSPSLDFYSAVFSPDTGSNSNVLMAETDNAYPGLRTSVYVPSKNAFLCYLGLTSQLEVIDLSFGITGERPSGVSSLGVSSLFLDSAGKAVVEVSVSPYYRKFNVSNWAAEPSVDAFYNQFSGEIVYGSGYMIGRARVGGGYKIYEVVSGELLDQTNPSVTAGDIYTYADHNYEVLIDNNDRPDIGAVASPPTWLDLGVINALRLIDGKIGTFTEGQEALTITIDRPQLIDGLGLFNMLASAFRIELVDATDSVVFDSGEITLSDLSGIQDWYTYFYDPESYQTDSVFTALPPYKEASIRITLSAIDGITRIGELVAGRVRNIGDTEFGVDVGILDFSRKERDEFGNLVITERQFSKRADYPVSIRSNRIAAIQQLLAGLRATPTVFIGAESQPETVVYGFYRGFNLVLRGPVFSECSIEVEGLT